MFFFLSKTLYYLVLPVSIVFLCLLAAAIVKKQRYKKRLIVISLVAFYIFSNDFLGNTILKAWEVPPIAFDSISKTYDYGIVLTGILQNEQTPADRPFFNKGADRVFHTYLLYKKGIIKKILISGGVGRLVEVDYKEADNLRNIFLSMGVPKEDLITEVNSRNTAESAINVSKMVKQDQKLLLITSAFHMRRARDSFYRQNIAMDIFPVDYYSDQHLTFDSYVIPTLDGYTKWTRFIQEFTGYIAYDIVGYI